MKRTVFCPSCGSDEFAQHNVKAWHCNRCEFVYYHNTAAAVVGVLKCHNEILLTIRKNDPCKGMYDFPGGFVDYHETLEAGLTREIKEELQIDIEDWQYLFSYPNQYRYRGTTYHTADAFFTREFDEKPVIVASDDVADAVWIGLEDIDLERVGFTSIRQAIRRLRGTA